MYICDVWTPQGTKVKILNRFFHGRIGVVKGFAWPTGEYIVILDSGAPAVFRPCELQAI